jgi:hypothetical protein
VTIAKWERERIEWTVDDLWLRVRGTEMRKVDVVEKPSLYGAGKESREDAFDPAGSTPPINLHATFAILGKGDAGPSVEHRLTNRSDCPGIIDVGAEIPAVIDTAENPVRVRNNFVKTKSTAIGWGAVNGVSTITASLNPHRPFVGDRVTDSGLRSGGCDHEQVAKTFGCTDQRQQARSVDAVVIAEQKFHEGKLGI